MLNKSEAGGRVGQGIWLPGGGVGRAPSENCVRVLPEPNNITAGTPAVRLGRLDAL